MPVSRRLTLTLCCVSLLITGCDWHKVTGVQWKDIASWKALGTRWASAYNADGKRIALFDLSHLSIRQELELGLLGARQIKVKDAIAEIRTGMKENLPVVGKTVAAVTARIAAMEGYLQTLERERNPEDPYDQLPDHWWEKLPWKPAKLSKMAGEPSEFSIDDFDLESVVTDVPKYRAQLAALETASEEKDGAPILGKGFLANLKFERLPEGGYRMKWSPGNLSVLDQPRKMVDLTLIYSGVIENGVWTGLKDGVSELAGLDPEPVTKALLQTALGRLFHAHDLMTDMHRGMLIEMGRLADAMPSALSELDPAEMKIADGSMVLTDQSLYMVPTFLWRKPEQVWKKNEDGENKQAGKAHGWLDKHGFEVHRISPRFDEAYRDGKHYLLALPYKTSFLSDSPVVSLRYDQVEETRAHRERIEILSAAVDFATHFIPVVGGFVGDIYGWTVEDPLDKHKLWESRLKISLLENPMHSERDWTAELDLLDRQKVDFLELPFREAADLVATRKKQLGI